MVHLLDGMSAAPSSLFGVAIAVAIAIGQMGCATKTAPSTSDPFTMLHKGMSAEQVRALVGEPRTIKPGESADMKVELWTYTRKIWTTTTTEATRTREVPYFDPFINAIRMVPEPDYQPLTIDVVERITLVMIEDQISQIIVAREGARDYR